MAREGRTKNWNGVVGSDAYELRRRSIEFVPVVALFGAPRNVRTHSKKQIRQIAASIARFGFSVPLVINRANTILAGHGRHAAALQLGLREVPCIRVSDLSPADERAFALADNKLAENAGTNRELLALELSELEGLLADLELPADLEITGYSPAEIDALESDFGLMTGADTDEIVVELESGQPVTCSGDLWRLGKHLVFCGDARLSSSYEILSSGVPAEAVISDLPFNVPVKGHVSGRGQKKHTEFAFASGEMKEAEFHSFVSEGIGRQAEFCRPGALVYTFCDWRSVELFCRVGRELGLTLVNICIWSKTTPGQGSFYRSAHELICVFAKPGGERRNNIQLGRFGRSRTNVWTYPAPNKFAKANDAIGQHPTPKPVSMIAEAIKDATARGGLVLDAFLGSGTTILAAEKVGRIGYGIEYEPRFVDLTVRRWQAMTGADAVLATTGQTFEDVGKGRGVEEASRSSRMPRGRIAGRS